MMENMEHTFWKALFDVFSTSHKSSCKVETRLSVHLANILGLRHFASHGSQVAAQGAAEELEQHLETYAGESRVVAAPRLVEMC